MPNVAPGQRRSSVEGFAPAGDARRSPFRRASSTNAFCGADYPAVLHDGETIQQRRESAVAVRFSDREWTPGDRIHDQVRRSLDVLSGALLAVDRSLQPGIDGRVLDDVAAPITGAMIRSLGPTATTRRMFTATSKVPST